MVDASSRGLYYRERGWWPGVPLADAFAVHLRSDPDALAVVDDAGRRLTRAQLDNAAEHFASRLTSLGVTAGDVVLIFMPNCSAWQIVLLGVLRAGAVPASLPVRTDEANLTYVVELCGAQAIVTAGEDDPSVCALAYKGAAACNSAPIVVVLEDEAKDVTITMPRRAEPELASLVDHVMFTSSTTGKPKGVLHTADTLAALNITFAERFDLNAQTPIFMPSPLGHSIGTIHGARLALHCGAPLVIQSRWDVSQALDLVAQHGCYFTAAATPFLKDLVDASARASSVKLESMRWFLCGGAQVPPTLMDRAETEFPNTRVTVLWGMTEGGLTTSVADSPRDKMLSTAGIALPGLELRIISPSGEDVELGGEGELSMRGPGVFTGYCGQDDLYQSTLTPDGYFCTGDLARIDGGGYVAITGRLKDIIIRGGVNISPVPIENALAAHADIQAVAVVGYPDERLGERICAVVVLSPGAQLNEADVQAFAQSSGLPKSYWPEVVRFMPDFPRTPAGKIRKNLVRDEITRNYC